ncbi:hypothetical protein [Paenibacillus phocaensis]|uniref:hypothetical protein n=1 Tax=Paenibacillus phocaensis TaxID=1776378 RepID=UPI000AFA6F17|nr:hypothetical protein [Paenibacillus phocaensis]
MYGNKDTILDMELRHADLLNRLDQSAERLEAVLTELPVPQSVQAYVRLQGMIRFHNSLLALRLLVVSGFGDEASAVLRRMEKAAVLVNYVSTHGEQQWEPLLAGEAPLIPSAPVGAAGEDAPDLRTLAEESGMSEGYDDLRPDSPLDGTALLFATDETEDWFPPIGPAPFDAADVLAKGCRLADMLIDAVDHGWNRSLNS